MIYNEYIIMESDGDSPLVATLSIGMNILKETVICLSVSDYGREGSHVPTRNTMAIIDNYEVALLAKRWNIPVTEVNQHLASKFREEGYISRTSYVRGKFQQMLHYILDNGGKYHIK